MPPKTVALLRGVNVGGHRRLPMAQLVDCLESAGFSDVVTYLQSGNVAFRAPKVLDVGAVLGQLVAERFGFDVELTLRTAAELAAIVAATPYPTDEPTALHVAFLESPPDPAVAAAVDLAPFAPESFTVAGREVYLHLPGGMGTARLPSRLAFVRGATMRNWNTVTALAALAQG